jgi:hypothetical protein
MSEDGGDMTTTFGGTTGSRTMWIIAPFGHFKSRSGSRDLRRYLAPAGSVAPFF